MNGREVLITGVGLVTSLGRNAEENLAGLKQGRTGLRETPREGLPRAVGIVGQAGEVDALAGLNPRLLPHAKFLNRGSLLGLAAAREAERNAGLNLLDVPPERKSAYVGGGDMDRIDYRDFYPAMREATGGAWERVDAARLNKASLGGVNPFFLLESLYNNIFSFLTAVFEVRGPSTSLAAQSPCGAQAAALAFRSVQEGLADAALAVGSCNWISALAACELRGLCLLSQGREGVRSFRPFDRRRDGFFPGEGAAALLLESAEHARGRGARALGRILGAADAIEPPTSGGFGIPRQAALTSARQALAEAGLAPAELGLVSPHASGTRKGDRTEMEALLALLGDDAPRVPVACLKPSTGHMAAASDVADLALGLMALREGFVPGTLHFERADEGCEPLSVSAEIRAADRRTLLSLSYGLGGQVSALVAAAE